MRGRAPEMKNLDPAVLAEHKKALEAIRAKQDLDQQEDDDLVELGLDDLEAIAEPPSRAAIET